MKREKSSPLFAVLPTNRRRLLSGVEQVLGTAYSSIELWYPVGYYKSIGLFRNLAELKELKINLQRLIDAIGHPFKVAGKFRIDMSHSVRAVFIPNDLKHRLSFGCLFSESL